MPLTVYVQEQGVKVRKRDQQMLITQRGKELRTVPLEQVQEVVIMGRGVEVSTVLLTELASRGVPVTYTNQAGTRVTFQVQSGISPYAQLRHQQMERLYDPQSALDLARQMILAKLENQRSLLAALRWPAGVAASATITTVIQSLPQATTLDQVRGYEGAGAATYWGAWRATLPTVWGFGGRAFYPPPDPVNALLSFGYTLALQEVLAVIQRKGLDPYLGTFHVPEPGRPSLALDLLEEFRAPLVDRLVLELLRTGLVTPTDFEQPADRPGAVYLGQAGRATVIAQFTERMRQPVTIGGQITELRRVIVLQVETLMRVLRQEQPQYQGWRA